jgi:hypothetical protein
MPHEKCLSYLKASDAGLLIIDKAPAEWGIIPGKIFEYMGTGRPILALAPAESDAAQLVRKYRLGVVADPNNPNDIKKAITQLFRTKPQENILAKFERKNLTGQLAFLFDKTLKTIAV